MAPKKNTREPTPSIPVTTQPTSTPIDRPVTPQPKAVVSTSPKNAPVSWDQVLQNIYNYYMKETPQRTKLIDIFLVFLVAVGALQFVYCILAGNYVGPE